ncbi:MAG: GNAT family N-acetyltransferase [Verrucomicrobiota bacterium]|nr:GNAT family N-acetyltransferase [Verrucomicrobiota bacterium]
MANRLNIPWHKLLKPGSRIYVGAGAACPHLLLQDLVSEAQPGGDWELVLPPLFGQPEWLQMAREKGMRLIRLHGRVPGTAEASGHLVDTLGANSIEITRLIRERHLPIDAAVVMTTLPDEAGSVGYGTNHDTTDAACGAAGVVIAQLNSSLPDYPGSARFPFHRISHWVEEAVEPSVLPLVQASACHLAAVRSLVPLIPDGCTLRFPLGPYGQALMPLLTERRHMQVYTDVLSDAVLNLLVAGALEPLGHLPALCGSAVAGTTELYQSLSKAKSLRLEPLDSLCAPARLASITQLIALVTPIAVDLAGRAVLKNDPAGRAFIQAASSSSGGIAIAVLNAESAPNHGIIAQPHEHSGDFVQPEVVITEYGAAQLSGRTESERAAALIEVAAPGRRKSLWEHACREHGLPRFWPVQWQRTAETEPCDVQRILLKDGNPYLCRPLRPSDSRLLREFFYSHTEETIRSRYGFQLRRMSLERALELTGVDQAHDVGLGLFSINASNQTIDAVGRYYLDIERNTGEVAFVTRESRRRLGLARHLLDVLIGIATRRGLKSLWAQVDRTNASMLRLFQSIGFVSRATEDIQTLRLNLVLSHSEVQETRE